MIRSLPPIIRRLLAAAAASSVALSVSCSADTSALAGAIYGNGTKSAGGRVSLAVEIEGSGSQTIAGTTDTKTELAQADLAFDLVPVQGIGGQIFKWDDAIYGGTSRWYEELIEPAFFQIPGTKQIVPCNRVDSTVWNFSSAAAGGQPGSVKLELQGDQYQLWVSAGAGGPTTETLIHVTNCTADGHFERSSTSGILNLVPYAGYFNSADGSDAGVTVTRPLGKGATRVNDVLQWTDKMAIFSFGTTVVTVPVTVRLTWDFTIQ